MRAPGLSAERAAIGAYAAAPPAAAGPCRRTRRRRGGLAALALVLVASGLCARPVIAAPSPLPTPMGLVSDFAGALDPETKGLILARLVELRRLTGAEIAVVTVPTTAPDTAFDYAMRLAEQWKPGVAGKENGVVFLIAVKDRDMFIATGYGLEGALPDGLVGEIRDRDILPHFRAGDLNGGVRAGVERLAAIIAKEYGVTLGPVRNAPKGRQRAPASGVFGPWTPLLLLFVFFVALPALSRGMTGGRRRRSGFWGPTMWGGGFGGGGFGGPGGGFGGGGGGGFGGFGGGSFGGGGAGGKW